MRNLISALLIAVLMIGSVTGCGSGVSEQDSKNDVSEQDSKIDVSEQDPKKEVKRVGMVIKINPEYIEEYRALHSDSNAGVRDLLTKAHMHNFSIFLHQLDDGNWYEFGYYEYTGDDFEADMATLDKHPRNIEWLKVCDPMQVPLEGYDGWAEMDQVYFNQ